jgi:ArsR family transcriptional regulator
MSNQRSAANETGGVQMLAQGDGALTAKGCCCALGPSLRLEAEEALELAAMFKALGNPVRLQIVELLSRYAGQVCVCDVEGQFELSQPTISHHLKILREAGLVASEQRGLWVYYFLRPQAVDKLRGLLGGLVEGHC